MKLDAVKKILQALETLIITASSQIWTPLIDSSNLFIKVFEPIHVQKEVGWDL